MKLQMLILLSLGLGAVTNAFSRNSTQATQATRVTRAHEVDSAVMHKLFPKKHKTEISAVDFGVILNQSYIDTVFVQSAVVRHLTEEFGVGIEGMFASNTDKNERKCLEEFFNYSEGNSGVQCGSPTQLAESNAVNYGPAYVPIREIQYIVSGIAVWSPIYGKQLFFMSATSYFDVFLVGGAGLVASKYYPKRSVLRNSKQSRGRISSDESDNPSIGAESAELDAEGLLSYGPQGRPEVLSEKHAMLTFGVGQKYHFAKRFNLKLETRSYTILNTDSGFEQFFTLTGGIGVRL